MLSFLFRLISAAFTSTLTLTLIGATIFKELTFKVWSVCCRLLLHNIARSLKMQTFGCGILHQSANVSAH